MPSRRAPKNANQKAPEEQYWKKPSKNDASDSEETKSSAAEASDDDGQEKIMVERYWKREPSTQKGYEAPSGEEKIIISRQWKKKSSGISSGTADKETNRSSSNWPSASGRKSDSSSSSSSSSSAASSKSDSSSSSEVSSDSEQSRSDSSGSDDEFIEHYWTRKTRVHPRARNSGDGNRKSKGHRSTSRSSRPAICQKCGSYRYPRKH